MRRAHRENLRAVHRTGPATGRGCRAVRLAWVGILGAGLAAAIAGCSDGLVDVPGGGSKSAAAVRAARRAYDGAPPVVAHTDFGITCTQCHNDEGIEIPDVGYAPATPHADTRGLSVGSRCRQCHVFAQTDELFVANEFVPLRQDLRRGQRLNSLAPPVIPHRTLMRDNCAACHTGPAAREQIRTPHPERVRCRQCHVAATTRELFGRRPSDAPR